MTLREITSDLYEQLSGPERRLAENAFSQYARSSGQNRPADFTDNDYRAAKRSYTRGMMFPVFLGNMFLLIAGGLIGLGAGQLQFLAPAITICVLYGFVLALSTRRAVQITQYFRTHEC